VALRVNHRQWAIVAVLIISSTSLADLQAQESEHAHDAHAHPQIENLLRMIVPPLGWQMDSNLSSDRARALASYPHLGGLHALTSAEVWLPNEPANAGVALVVSRIVATEAQQDDQKIAVAAIAARLEFYNSVSATLGKMAGEPLPVPVLSMSGNQELILTLQASSANAVLRMARDSQRIETVTAECLVSENAPISNAKALCVAALESASSSIPFRARRTMEVALASMNNAAFAASVRAQESGQGSPTMDDATPSLVPTGSGKLTFPTMTLVPPAKPRDLRPVYVGAAILLCAIVLYLNRRYRQRLELQDGRSVRGQDSR
jgi:hypothetical protein